jgi:hypothetical protein
MMAEAQNAGREFVEINAGAFVGIWGETIECRIAAN